MNDLKEDHFGFYNFKIILVGDGGVGKTSTIKRYVFDEFILDYKATIGSNIYVKDLHYKDKNVKVEAFLVKHGTWPNAYGFRFTTPDKVIVISGDTAPCKNIIKYSKGADILIHEVYYKKGYDTKDEIWKKYHADHHTSTYELAEIVNKTNPELLVLYHTLYWGGTDQDILNEIKEKYDGKVVVGKDMELIK